MLATLNTGKIAPQKRNKASSCHSQSPELGPKPGSSREDVFDLRGKFLIDGDLPKTQGFPSLEMSGIGQQTHYMSQGGVTASVTVETILVL